MSFAKKIPKKKRPTKIKLSRSRLIYKLLRRPAVLFGLIFALFGTYMVVRSFAAEPVGDYIVILKEDVNTDTAADKHAKTYGAEIKYKYYNALKGYAAKVPDKRILALRSEDNVKSIAPDTKVEAFAQTLGTGINRINAENKTNQATGVNVAVLDTGIDLTHPDLAGQVVGGTNCSKGSRGSYADDNGHGTHVAGIIAALNNDVGVVGVAPGAKLWSVKVLNSKGTGSTSDIVCGIDFVDSKSPAKGGPIKVANMSLGGLGGDDGNCGNTSPDAMHIAVCRAVADGVAFVVAAGNSTSDISQVQPAAYDEVLTVTGLGDADGQPCGLGPRSTWAADDTFVNFSNYASSSLDQNHSIAAPGLNIYSTYKDGTYKVGSGTSMASPHVAGAAALYIATHPNATPAEVRSSLRQLGEPKNVNFNNDCGSTTTSKKSTTTKSSHTDPTNRNPEVELRADFL